MPALWPHDSAMDAIDQPAEESLAPSPPKSAFRAAMNRKVTLQINPLSAEHLSRILAARIQRAELNGDWDIPDPFKIDGPKVFITDEVRQQVIDDINADADPSDGLYRIETKSDGGLVLKILHTHRDRGGLDRPAGLE